MPEESMLKDIVKVPLMAVTIVIISAIGIYFKVPLMIPPFAATLFMIYLREGSEFSHVKNVLGGHIIGFGCAFLEPFISPYLTFLPSEVSSALVIGIAILISGWLMALTTTEHPPAAATTLLFFNIEKQGVLLFDTIPLQAGIAFFFGLAIISGISYFIFRRSR
jgi:CBS-domain-containing membrane protein